MSEFILDYGSPDAARTFRILDAFTQGYITALFFTETYDAEQDLADASFGELAPETLDQIKADCAAFQAAAGGLINDDSRHGPDDTAEEHAGRDFLYTRNGHGCGFWDGDWSEPTASKLDALARSFPETGLYRGDDGIVHVM